MSYIVPVGDLGDIVPEAKRVVDVRRTEGVGFFL